MELIYIIKVNATETSNWERMQLRQVTENECSVKCLMKNPTECEVGANSYNASKTKESRRLLNWVSST